MNIPPLRLLNLLPRRARPDDELSVKSIPTPAQALLQVDGQAYTDRIGHWVPLADLSITDTVDPRNNVSKSFTDDMPHSLSIWNGVPGRTYVIAGDWTDSTAYSNTVVLGRNGLLVSVMHPNQ